jgi:alkaline phosphatase
MLRTYFLFAFLLLICNKASAQPGYSSSNAHAHNDYEQPYPFWQAYHQGFGSIEVDIFLHNGQLLVAHDLKDISEKRNLESLYLRPIDSVLRRLAGRIYADEKKTLQLMIDLKTEASSTLAALIGLMEKYPMLVNGKGLKIVISGNRPVPERFGNYPAWLYFDGIPSLEYSDQALSRVAMFSDNFRRYSSWNGKGRIPENERQQLLTVIAQAKKSGKPFRFWNAPDNINSWYALMELGVGYINTDHIPELGTFLQQLPATRYSQTESLPVYMPTYRSDGKGTKARNVILLIGDGMGLPQLYAAYTANHAALNIFNMRHTGLSKTSSYDAYITDSGPGSTAFSSGVKTNNRSVGVDHKGQPLPLLPQILKKINIRSGIITAGDMTDATPADFYAHQAERSNSEAILRDLIQSPVDIVMGAPAPKVSKALYDSMAMIFSVYGTLQNMPSAPKLPLVIMDTMAGKPVGNGRGQWLQQAFRKSLDLLSGEKAGFFLMVEGAQIDNGGHSNNLVYLVSELLDFDQAVAEAIRFADEDGETLVIVTGDHETGGLTLHAGNYEKGYVSGRFATDDHTALPVPVFAYGPGAQLFTGVYENTDIFHKIMRVFAGQ